MSKFKPKYSIIVPVYNAEKFIDLFMDNLLLVNFPHHMFEAVFINNNSKDNSYALLQKRKKELTSLNITLVNYKEKQESYASRNYGISFSTGDILIFTDIDCKIDKDFFVGIVENNHSKVVISGNIIVEIKNLHNLWECFDSIAHLNNKKNASLSKIATANMIVSKSDFLDIGFFDERYSGGDHAWSKKAVSLGYKIKYVDEVVVFHPSRKTFYEILKKSRRFAYGKGLDLNNREKSILKTKFLYFLKIFNFFTNINYTIELSKLGFNFFSLVNFNFHFFIMRINQFIYLSYGYKKFNLSKVKLD